MTRPIDSGDDMLPTAMVIEPGTVLRDEPMCPPGIFASYHVGLIDSMTVEVPLPEGWISKDASGRRVIAHKGSSLVLTDVEFDFDGLEFEAACALSMLMVAHEFAEFADLFDPHPDDGAEVHWGAMARDALALVQKWQKDYPRRAA